MPRKPVLFASLVAVGLTLSSCATLVRGPRDLTNFESTPAGAVVTVESADGDLMGPYTCTTPCELELKRKKKWNVVYQLSGYKPAAGYLVPRVTGGGVASGAGNALLSLGGLVGVGVDAGTGANLDLRPNPMHALLAATDSDDISTIVLSDEDRALVAEADLDDPAS